MRYMRSMWVGRGRMSAAVTSCAVLPEPEPEPAPLPGPAPSDPPGPVIVPEPEPVPHEPPGPVIVPEPHTSTGRRRAPGDACGHLVGATARCPVPL